MSTCGAGRRKVVELVRAEEELGEVGTICVLSKRGIDYERKRVKLKEEE